MDHPEAPKGSPNTALLKLVPLFLLLAALFIGAIWLGITYSQQKQARIPQGDAHVVELLNDHADPNTLIIKTGELVQFSAKDGLSHRIVQDKAEGIKTEEFSDQYRTKFDKPGTYNFQDSLHPSIVVEVIVIDPT